MTESEKYKLGLTLVVLSTVAPPPLLRLHDHQEQRRRWLREACAEDGVTFPGKKRSFDDIPNKALDHLIVDDRHGIIFCYVPKVGLVLGLVLGLVVGLVVGLVLGLVVGLVVIIIIMD